MKNLIVIIFALSFLTSCAKTPLIPVPMSANINIRYDDIQAAYNKFSNGNTSTNHHAANGQIVAWNIDYVVINCPEVVQNGNFWSFSNRTYNVAISISQIKMMLQGTGFGVDPMGTKARFETVRASSNGSYYSQNGYVAYYLMR